MKYSRNLVLSALAFALAVVAGSAFAGDKFITVQSTTSTQNSGLLDYLLPKFTAMTGIEVRVVAVGTGQAIKNARNGDGDVLLVHAKASEEKFVADGFGVERFDLMYNDFVVVGPAGDPAKVGGSRTPWPRCRRSQRPRPPSPRAATIQAPTRRSCRCGRRPASTSPRPPAAGTAKPAREWARR